VQRRRGCLASVGPPNGRDRDAVSAPFPLVCNHSAARASGITIERLQFRMSTTLGAWKPPSWSGSEDARPLVNGRHVAQNALLHGKHMVQGIGKVAPIRCWATGEFRPALAVGAVVRPETCILGALVTST
jgi:hypothetical protein